MFSYLTYKSGSALFDLQFSISCRNPKSINTHVLLSYHHMMHFLMYLQLITIFIYLFKHKVRVLPHWLNTDTFRTVPTVQLQTNFLFECKQETEICLFKFRTALGDIRVCVNMCTVCVQLGVTWEAGHTESCVNQPFVKNQLL